MPGLDSPRAKACWLTAITHWAVTETVISCGRAGCPEGREWRDLSTFVKIHLPSLSLSVIPLRSQPGTAARFESIGRVPRGPRSPQSAPSAPAWGKPTPFRRASTFHSLAILAMALALPKPQFLICKMGAVYVGLTRGLK